MAYNRHSSAGDFSMPLLGDEDDEAAPSMPILFSDDEGERPVAPTATKAGPSGRRADKGNFSVRSSAGQRSPGGTPHAKPRLASVLKVKKSKSRLPIELLASDACPAGPSKQKKELLKAAMMEQYMPTASGSSSSKSKKKRGENEGEQEKGLGIPGGGSANGSAYQRSQDQGQLFASLMQGPNGNGGQASFYAGGQEANQQVVQNMSSQYYAAGGSGWPSQQQQQQVTGTTELNSLMDEIFSAHDMYTEDGGDGGTQQAVGGQAAGGQLSGQGQLGMGFFQQPGSPSLFDMNPQLTMGAAADQEQGMGQNGQGLQLQQSDGSDTPPMNQWWL